MPISEINSYEKVYMYKSEREIHLCNFLLMKEENWLLTAICSSTLHEFTGLVLSMEFKNSKCKKYYLFSVYNNYQHANPF